MKIAFIMAIIYLCNPKLSKKKRKYSKKPIEGKPIIIKDNIPRFGDLK